MTINKLILDAFSGTGNGVAMNIGTDMCLHSGYCADIILCLSNGNSLS